MGLPRTEWRTRPSLTEIVCLVVGVTLLWSYAWIMDDAYVYFRYVDNLVIHDAGLVWNPGEFVEGFSSPAWALALAALRSLKLNYWTIVRGAGVLSYIAFWWLAVLINRKLAAPQTSGWSSLNLPLIYLTFTYGAMCCFTSGLETPLVLVLAAAYACLFLWPESTTYQVLVGLSPLVRHELVIPLAIALAFAAYRTRRPPVAALASFVLGTGGYLAFRIWYYADLFPNTFHLKDELWLAQGARYVYDTLIAYPTVPYLIGAAVLYRVLRGRFDARALGFAPRLAMVAAALPVALYVIKVGGDPRHFKALAFPFSLAVLATGGLLETAGSAWAARARTALIAVALALAVAAGVGYPRQLRDHPLLNLRNAKHRQFLRINDAAAHRSRDAGTTPWDRGSTATLAFEAADRRGQSSGVSSVLSEDWCRTAYVRASASVVHSLGLTEPFLARVRVRSDRAGHKFGLRPLADELARVRQVHGFRAGAFDAAIERGLAPGWMRNGIASLRLIEAKVYNGHAFAENLRLALTPIEEIVPGPSAGTAGGPAQGRESTPGASGGRASE
jgi:hypothetical protein